MGGAGMADLAVNAPLEGRRCSAGSGGAMTDVASAYAAIDLGTNNCRMLIARPDGERFRIVDSFSRITRLGEGLAETGILSVAAQERTLDALRSCAEKIGRLGLVRSRHVATEGCRRAGNGLEFLATVYRETGLTIECISPAEEACLALVGCSGLFSAGASSIFLFDIGGGSTELVLIVQGASGLRVEGFMSLPFGVVTVADACGGGDFAYRTYREVCTRIRSMVQPFGARHNLAERVTTGQLQVVGTSGTITTLGAFHLGLTRYDRAAVDGLDVSCAAILDAGQRLMGMTARQRADSPCIGPQRADLVIAGCAILEAVFSLWPGGSLTIADRGLREGLLMGLMGVRNTPADFGMECISQVY
ncbi:Ppx/GppA phosphatase family protein [Haematospirillum jordaniae]|nr:Ppx/GppA phosphatase family protein [Haematospirillum jordaniae]